MTAPLATRTNSDDRVTPPTILLALQALRTMDGLFAAATWRSTKADDAAENARVTLAELLDEVGVAVHYEREWHEERGL